MNRAWLTIVVLTVATIAIKATGPVLVGRRALPPTFARVIALLAPALLAALIVTDTFGAGGRSLTIDARAGGLAAAAAILAVSRSLIGAVVGAAVATALLRFLL
ncbi:MAG: AzlD domain-containing protein [Thermoleophilaceae bacterium]